MKTYSLIAAALCLLMFMTVPIAHFALASPPRPVSPKETEGRWIPDVPSEASHAHHIRLRILNVTALERVDETQILKLEVERLYGKIETDSLNRAKKHETQRFTILFPASLDADIRPGDLLNYWLVGYAAMGRE